MTYEEQYIKKIEELKKSCLEFLPLIQGDIEQICNNANKSNYYSTVDRLESIETALGQVRTW
jgi:hypothetical protein